MARPIGEVGRVAGERAIGPAGLHTSGASAKFESLIESRLRVSLVIPLRETAVEKTAAAWGRFAAGRMLECFDMGIGALERLVLDEHRLH
jgi:hypothetical protein